MRAEQEQFKFDMTPFTTNDCIPDDKTSSIVGKVVANAEVNRCEYRHSAYQLVLVDGGHGARGGRGRRCSGLALRTGKKARQMGKVRRAWRSQARKKCPIGRRKPPPESDGGKGEEIKKQGGTLMEIRALTQPEQKYTLCRKHTA